MEIWCSSPKIYAAGLKMLTCEEGEENRILKKISETVWNAKTNASHGKYIFMTVGNFLEAFIHSITPT